VINPVTSRIWVYRIAFLGLCAIIVFFHLLPMQTIPTQWSAPDLLICLSFCWVVRRPDYLPALSVGIVFLISDMFFLRPPGLMAALAVLGTEFLRARSHFIREFPFLLEWAVVTVVIACVLLGNRLILLILMVDPPVLGLSLLQFIATSLAYPLTVLFSKYALGISKITPAELNR